MNYFREFFLSFFIGGMPVLLVFNAEGSSRMMELVIGLSPEDVVLCYYFVLLISHFFMAIIDYHFLKTKSDEVFSHYFRILRSFLYDAGFSLHAIYRVLIGAIPAAVSLVIYQGGADGALDLTLLASVLFFSTLFVSTNLTYLHRLSEPKNSQ